MIKRKLTWIPGKNIQLKHIRNREEQPAFEAGETRRITLVPVLLSIFLLLSSMWKQFEGFSFDIQWRLGVK